MALMLKCCGTDTHPWDRFEVEKCWLPSTLRCLVVGENPGDANSEYFYKRPANYDNDKVAVRRALLQGLHEHGLIRSATLEAFQEAGFLFDHAIRCQLPSKVISVERSKAMRYASDLVKEPNHLGLRVAEAGLVWVMGHVASNAVANVSGEFPKEKRKLSKDPFPGAISSDSRFFVSQYLTWRTERQASTITEAFKEFARKHDVFA
jgi:hypothetical protein